MLKDYPDVLTVLQVSEILRTGKNTAYALIRGNMIGHKRIGRRYLVPKSCLVDYLESARYNVACDGGQSDLSKGARS